MPSIQVSGLTKRFGETLAVAGISFTIPEGSFTTLLGPSGCGKTTTLRMLAGLERPDAGEITIGDRVVASSKSGVFVSVEDRNVGVVFQSYALWPHMTVFDHLAYPLRVRHQSAAMIAERVAKALDLVQLGEQRKRYPSELSGGQQQRVALARALVFNPSVLFLDEPLSNLDAALRAEMRSELARLHRETGVTSVYVTHDQSEALTLSDQILLMRLGEVVEQGPPDAIYERPRTVYGAQFVGAANCLPAKVERVGSGEATVVLETGERLRGVADWLQSGDVGKPVTVMMRPEDIALAPAGGENVLNGVVRQSTYFGSHNELLVSVGNESVKLRAARIEAKDVGRAISLHVDAAAVRVLPPR